MQYSSELCGFVSARLGRDSVAASLFLGRTRAGSHRKRSQNKVSFVLIVVVVRF